LKFDLTSKGLQIDERVLHWRKNRIYFNGTYFKNKNLHGNWVFVSFYISPMPQYINDTPKSGKTMFHHALLNPTDLNQSLFIRADTNETSHPRDLVIKGFNLEKFGIQFGPGRGPSVTGPKKSPKGKILDSRMKFFGWNVGSELDLAGKNVVIKDT
jgi:hypothetical protein